jgi:dTMP kinase
MPSRPLSESGPRFIVLEGIDGSGSTTQGERLTAWLRSKDIRSLFTHEPSRGPAGMLIRLALSKRLRGAVSDPHDPSEATGAPNPDLDPHTIALLYAADRMDHVSTEILPNLDSGRVVICDRYLMSSLAYQGLTVDEHWLIQINRFAPVPDLCIYLDVPVEHAKERMRRSRWTKELFEDEAQLRLIRERYLKLVGSPRPEFGPIVTVDASQSLDAVAKKVQANVEELLQGKPRPQRTPPLAEAGPHQ